MEYKWIVLTVTTVGALMAQLSVSSIVIALPQILADLNSSLAEGVWMITMYQLVVSVFVVGFGRVADKFGRVRMYVFGFFVYALGTGLSAVALSGPLLIIFRGVQGAGAACILVNGIAIAAEAFPRNELGLVIGVIFMVSSFGSIAGYSVGGAIVTLLGWRAIFVVTLVIAIFGTFWSHARLHEVSARVARQFDVTGMIAYVLSLTLVLLGLTLGPVTSTLSLSLLVVAGLFLALFIFLEKRHPQPILDLSLFSNRQFARGTIASVLTFIPTRAFPLVTTLYLEFVRGLSPLDVGLLLISGEAAFAALTFLSGFLSDRFGCKIFTVSGSAVIFVALILFAFVDSATSMFLILGIVSLLGVGRGLFGSPNATSIMSSVSPERYGIANGLRITVNSTAGVLSIPLVTALMTLVLPYDRAAQIISGVPFANEAETFGFIQALSFSLIILAVLTLLAVVPDLASKSKPTRLPR
jgi:MFS family permease